MTTIPWVARVFPDLLNLAPLAAGGQKVVFTGTHVTEGSIVLKIIMSNQQPERIVREIQAVQQVRSVRVPRIYETGVVAPEGQPFIWMREQRILGKNLREHLNSVRTMALADVMRMAVEILEALVDAENVHIVHRDVKPDNIMLDTSGGYWLLDFGIARHLDLQSLTATDQLNGPATLGYAPPEQYLNHKRDIDARADLFALGVTMHECLHGKNPFRDGARDAREVMKRIEGVPVPAATIPGDRTGEASRFLTALLQRRRDHRPATASDALSWAREIRTPSQKA